MKQQQQTNKQMNFYLNLTILFFIFLSSCIIFSTLALFTVSTLLVRMSQPPAGPGPGQQPQQPQYGPPPGMKKKYSFFFLKKTIFFLIDVCLFFFIIKVNNLELLLLVRELFKLVSKSLICI